MSIQYEKIDFNDEESYSYILTAKKIFATGYQLGHWELFTPEGVRVVKCDGSIVTVFSGYMWDGSTVVGNFYEDDVTLEASLIHDVLYNANKNPNDVKVPFTLWKADSIFAEYLAIGYGKKKMFFKKHLIPNFYKWGLWVLGTPWKFGNNDYYLLKKA